MEQRISMITLAVADLDRSRRFYEAGLGWAVVSGEAEGIVCFQLGGIVLALYDRAAFAEDAGLGDPDPNPGPNPDPDPGPAPRPSIALAHNTRAREEVDPDWRRDQQENRGQDQLDPGCRTLEVDRSPDGEEQKAPGGRLGGGVDATEQVAESVESDGRDENERRARHDEDVAEQSHALSSCRLGLPLTRFTGRPSM